MKMNVIDIVVSDIDAAIAFYARLGIRFEVDAQMPGHAGCDLPGGMHVMLDTEELRGSFTKSLGAADGARSFLGFQVDTPGEVDAKHAELVKAGYRSACDPWDAPWGMRFATVLDPDGNGADLYAYAPSNG